MLLDCCLRLWNLSVTLENMLMAGDAAGVLGVSCSLGIDYALLLKDGVCTEG